MNRDFTNDRREYAFGELNLEDMPLDPMQMFTRWYDQYAELSKPDATAFQLVSQGLDGFPQSRIVLLKEIRNRQFVFYTNYASSKGRELEAQPRVSMNFFWPDLERQVRIKGIAEKVDAAESEAYFSSRPLESQYGAMASPQSEVIANREELEKAYADIVAAGNPKRPEHWGGFQITPVEFEFWQGRRSRLHDRIRYRRDQDSSFRMERLAP